MKKMSTWYRKRCQPFFWYMCPLNQPSDMFINVLLQDVRHPKVRYTPKLNIESFFHGVWKRTAILVIATNICVTSMPYCWLYIPSDFSSIERINPYFWYIYIYVYIYDIYIHIYDIYIYINIWYIYIYINIWYISLLYPWRLLVQSLFFQLNPQVSHVFFSTRSSLAGAIWSHLVSHRLSHRKPGVPRPAPRWWSSFAGSRF